MSFQIPSYLFAHTGNHPLAHHRISMSVQVHLDKPHAHFTNLDFITGRVSLRISYSETIAAIVVKLEGESKTRLVPPSPYAGYDHPLYREKPGRAELEIHKVSK